MEIKQTYEHDGNEELCMNGEDYCFSFFVFPRAFAILKATEITRIFGGERTVFMFDDYSGDSFSLLSFSCYDTDFLLFPISFLVSPRCNFSSIFGVIFVNSDPKYTPYCKCTPLDRKPSVVADNSWVRFWFPFFLCSIPLPSNNCDILSGFFFFLFLLSAFNYMLCRKKHKLTRESSPN